MGVLRACGSGFRGLRGSGVSARRGAQKLVPRKSQVALSEGFPQQTLGPVVPEGVPETPLPQSLHTRSATNLSVTFSILDGLAWPLKPSEKHHKQDPLKPNKGKNAPGSHPVPVSMVSLANSSSAQYEPNNHLGGAPAPAGAARPGFAGGDLPGRRAESPLSDWASGLFHFGALRGSDVSGFWRTGIKAQSVGFTPKHVICEGSPRLFGVGMQSTLGAAAE